MAKPLPSFFTVGLTAITAFSILFATQFVTEPILENRENQVYLDLLDLNNFSGYTIGEFETASGELLEAGIQRYRTYRMEDQIVAMTYEVNTNGYASGLQFQIGIREGIIRQLFVMQHNETTGYGADALLDFPNAIHGLALNDTNAWTAELVSVSTGATFTRRGIVLSLTAIQADYASRIGT